MSIPALANTQFPDYSGSAKSGSAAARQDSTKTQQTGASAQLSDEQLAQVQKLKTRDREVRAHEQAHLSAAGGLATGGAHFQYVTGPDGVRYATGGDVGIDTSEVSGNPQATLAKADTIRRAALAPAQPSGQDLSVAGQASAMAAKARAELLKSQQAPNSGQHLNVRA
ncbi:putative metalloprotease CJM1_0395 family protein [Methylomonas sp. MED-D]|uniref:Catalase n=1 Tax=Methylomonas koyamae TaxID=702114 RepID=A0A177P3G0_9GAMM|nr:MULTISPECIES: putative metalloprotease CJM1_0395 family protein [Methylomonas]MDT4331417.1 putative metalloprotease CJM1_0395 family protein [Methylomonas sp. MV1]OAI23890.1 hypothetical protein A1355_21250 [Methylomonas koyamae]